MKKLFLVGALALATSTITSARVLDLPGSADVKMNEYTGEGTFTCTGVGYCGTIYRGVGLNTWYIYLNGWGTYELGKASNSEGSDMDPATYHGPLEGVSGVILETE